MLVNKVIQEKIKNTIKNIHCCTITMSFALTIAKQQEIQYQLMKGKIISEKSICKLYSSKQTPFCGMVTANLLSSMFTLSASIPAGSPCTKNTLFNDPVGIFETYSIISA